MSFKASVCAMGYDHSIDGTGWPDAVVVENDGDVITATYELRTYYPVDRDALLALADKMDHSATKLLKTNDLDSNRKHRSLRRKHAQGLMAASIRIREALNIGGD